MVLSSSKTGICKGFVVYVLVFGLIPDYQATKNYFKFMPHRGLKEMLKNVT